MNVLAVGSAGFQRSDYAVMLNEVLDPVLGRIIVERNYTDFLSFGKRGLIVTTLNLSFRMLNSCCSGNGRKDFKACHNA